jgi:hypothetical protein
MRDPVGDDAGDERDGAGPDAITVIRHENGATEDIARSSHEGKLRAES